MSYTRRVDKKLRQWKPYEAQARRVYGHLGRLWDMGLVEVRNGGPEWWRLLGLLAPKEQRRYRKLEARLVPGASFEQCMAALQLHNATSLEWYESHGPRIDILVTFHTRYSPHAMLKEFLRDMGTP